jgi:hypothetical protein
MRTGSEIFDILYAQETNDIVYRFTERLRYEMNPETTVVGVYMISFDLNKLIGTSPIDNELESKIIEYAKENGHYAGIRYEPSDWEEDDNGELPLVDDGLRWVGFSDIMTTLNEVASSYVNDVK